MTAASRIFAALAVVVAGLSVCVPVSAAPSEPLTGSFYMVSDLGNGPTLADEGHGNLVEILNLGLTAYHEVSEGGGWFELEDGSGLCLNIGTNTYGYSDSCAGATTEQWYKSGYLFENRHYGDYLSTIPANGEYVWTSSATGVDSEWATPGA